MFAKDQGVFPNRYQIIPRALVFATRGDSVLLLKGAPTKRLWANLFNGVGGHVERGEDPLTAARREFNEETGVDLTSPWLCAVITIDTGESAGIGMYVFRGTASSESLEPSREGAVEWVPFDKISTLPLVKDLPELLPRLLEMRATDPPLFAQYSYDQNDNLIIKFSN